MIILEMGINHFSWIKEANNYLNKKISDQKEIGLFIKSIIDNKIKCISGLIIYFDGNTLDSFF